MFFTYDKTKFNELVIIHRCSICIWVGPKKRSHVDFAEHRNHCIGDLIGRGFGVIAATPPTSIYPSGTTSF